MEPTILVSLIIACILAVERIISKIKKCRSGCCELDMKQDGNQPSSPKSIEINKV